MKQNIFYLLLFTIVFSSCQKENDPIYKSIFTWPEGTSDYAPYTIGSSFTYELKTINPANTDSFTLTVTKDTIIDSLGLRFYKLVSNKPSLQPTYFVNYNNGNLTEITYNLDYLGLGAIIVPEVIETTLKENLLENDSWTENKVVTYPITPTTGVNLDVTFVHTILQKNYTKNVLLKDFANCIAVKEVISTVVPPNFPWPPTVPRGSQFDNYYAKEAGLVQRDVYVNNTLKSTQKLKFYDIVK